MRDWAAPLHKWRKIVFGESVGYVKLLHVQLWESPIAAAAQYTKEIIKN